MIPPRDGRRIVYTPERVHRMFAKMRSELHEMHERHRAEVESLRQEITHIRAQFDALRSVSLARQRAEAELRELYRERSIQRARLAERDPSLPLQ